jgi:RluA family pseudouridine synthase
MPGIVEPDVNAGIRILHEDEAIIVVNKPAPLPMHPSGRFNKNTLQYFLASAYSPQRPRPAHRLDANTTGVVVWTRTRHFAKLLNPQFADGRHEKVYLVRTQGHPNTDSFSCNAPISAEPGAIGSRCVDDEAGLDALTDFQVIHRFADGTTLLEARPRTGRTNQIRIHLRQLGLPVCGDPAYLANGKIGPSMTLDPSQPPLCLHSWKLSFVHPLTKGRLTFNAPAPVWAEDASPQALYQE